MNALALPLTPDLCDSLRTLSLKRRQGILEILSPEREYELTFLDGRIIHADRLDTPLVEYLIRRLNDAQQGLLNRQQLDELSRVELLDHLCNVLKIPAQKLLYLKKQYDRETLLLLAKEQSISCDFRAKIVRCPEELSLDLSPGHLLLDLLEAMEISQGSQPAQAGASSKIEEPVKEVIKPRPGLADVGGAVSTEAKRARIREPHRRKIRRPKRIGRWKRKSQTSKKKFSFSVRGEQLFIGVKLILYLTLVVTIPPYFNDWVFRIIQFAIIR